jgi:two-component system chemotaxis response regulator CheY
MDGYGKRVLIVDGDESVRWTVASLLEGARFNVYQAGDGRCAVEELQKRRFDAIMLDYSLAQLNGQECLLLARLVSPRTPIVLLTDSPNDRPDPTAASGPFAVLPKGCESWRFLHVAAAASMAADALPPSDTVLAS